MEKSKEGRKDEERKGGSWKERRRGGMRENKWMDFQPQKRLNWCFPTNKGLKPSGGV